MRRLIRCAAVALMLTPAMGVAQDYEAGLAAYTAGDFATALGEWRPLAEQGDAAAQSNLGFMYRHGTGVPQDDAEALKWYRLVAEQGYAGAQFNLGDMYENGEGLPQDYTTAHMWFNIAAANGKADASERRDIVAALMTPAAIVEAQRRAGVCMDSNYQDCD